ncbi:T9SS type A sorting domain-containing protein [Candidatus Falkowbacteria bacterium]|nr:T9SS type A sorting domain-containing protein [Bacteroidales bacterium]NCU37044.1 T9SS type A sorting domain-containing protein [Candidatus Falkowbacteria bacterium]
MKTNFTLLLLLIFLAVMYGYSQEDKAPVAVNDYVEVMTFDTIEIKVLENDYSYENHPIVVSFATGGTHGTIVKTDTSIFYSASLGFQGLDSVFYRIRDLENNLVSDLARVYITVNSGSFVIGEGFDFLDVNQVRCRVNSFGLQFWDLGNGTDVNYEVPAGSGKYTIFSEALWIGGLDENDALCLAAERYRQSGTDFFPGPVMDSLAYNPVLDSVWNKVWKLSSDEIAFHRQHWQDEGYQAIKNIIQWPGNGDVNLGQAAQLAPYYDWNGNGIYDPLAGDFPLIRGDQTVFTIVNDARYLHTETGGRKLGVEIQTAYYAYDEPNDSLLKYTTFADQRIINRSPHTYHDVYAANFVDFDLGYYGNDYLCCDTLLHSAIVYNGTEEDGNGGTGEYGAHPPAQSFTCLNYTMDAFVYSLNYGVPQPMTDPYSDTEYYSCLQALWKDSTPFTYGGNGYGGEQAVKFVFPGDPVTGEGWTEANAENVPGDRRGLVVSGPHNLNPGDTLHLEYALVFARDFEGDNLSSLALLKNRIQQVHTFYQNALGIEKPDPTIKTVNLYPNPCTNDLFIDVSQFPAGTTVDFAVFDILGKQLMHGRLNPKSENVVDFSKLDPGIYFVRFVDGKNSYTKKVIRE